ncbi:hypothetical protein ACE10Z_09400 [Bradyrhizobium sp. Pha-3]|uniref:hypothetical protein n=1 Tax=Bradyrhizobium sp. Pha-3 TaxID=208375 RepID=UPI0035D50163
MQKIAAAFERHGALSFALCCNISAFAEKFCGSSNRHDSAGKLAAACSGPQPEGCTSND